MTKGDLVLHREVPYGDGGTQAYTLMAGVTPPIMEGMKDSDEGARPSPREPGGRG